MDGEQPGTPCVDPAPFLPTQHPGYRKLSTCLRQVGVDPGWSGEVRGGRSCSVAFGVVGVGAV